MKRYVMFLLAACCISWMLLAEETIERPFVFSWNVGIQQFLDDSYSDYYDYGVNASIAFEAKLTQFFAFGVKTGYFFHNHEDYHDTDFKGGYTNLLMILVLNAPKPVQAFFFAGPGMYYTYDDYYDYDDDYYYDRDDTDFYAGYTLGTGFEVMNKSGFSIGVQAVYHKVFADPDYDVISGEMAIRYHF